MINKKPITETRACEIFWGNLFNGADVALEELKKLHPGEFQNVDIEKAKSLFFSASLYCAMIQLGQVFDTAQAERIKKLITIKLSSDVLFKQQKEIHQAFMTWDEPLYKQSPEHPFENIARYLCLKWAIPDHEIKIGANSIERPSLYLVGIIENMLLECSTLWKVISEQYSLTESI